MDDLRAEPHPAQNLDPESDAMCLAVSRCCGPFLHASKTLGAAVRWSSRAGVREEGAGVNVRTVRIDLHDLLGNGDLQAGDIVDVSHGEWFGENFWALHVSLETKEVLIKWRGSVPLYAFAFIESGLGHVLGKLQDKLEKAKSGSQPSGLRSLAPAPHAPPPAAPHAPPPAAPLSSTVPPPPLPQGLQPKGDGAVAVGSQPSEGAMRADAIMEDTAKEEGDKAKKDEHIQEASQVDPAQLEAVIQQASTRKAVELKARVSDEIWRQTQAVRAIESAYLAQVREATRETQAEIRRLGWRSSDPDLVHSQCRGFVRIAQIQRRLDAQELLETQPFVDARATRRALADRLRARILDACGGYPDEAILLADFSKRALQGSQPSAERFPEAVNYKDLLVGADLIRLPEDYRGRKPMANVQEQSLRWWELEDGWGWGKWWMDLGGFKRSTDLDANGWSALHHAVDATSYSTRASKAAFMLIEVTPADIINASTTGSQPLGYTALHFACDGSDRDFKRAQIVSRVAAKRADLEATTAKGSTPFLLASATGVTDIATALVALGCDTNATNYLQKSAWQMASGSSGTSRKQCEDAGVPKTHVDESGMTRTGVGQSRQTRYARLQSETNTDAPFGSQPSRAPRYEQSRTNRNWWWDNDTSRWVWWRP